MMNSAYAHRYVKPPVQARRLPNGSVALLVLFIAGCTVGPDYVKPTAPSPTAFKEAQGWKIAEPQDQLLRGKWWEVFNDADLNTLEEQVAISNQNVRVYEARFREAQALVASARSAYFPTVTGSVSNTRARTSSGVNNAPTNNLGNNQSTGIRVNDALSFSVSWEPDVWGSVRRTVEANQASSDASIGDLAGARLSAQAELAQDYFSLRVADTQQKILDDSVAAYQKALTVTQNRYAAGVVSKADVLQAQTQLTSTQAQALDNGIQRAQTEHAIALLIGKAPAELSIPPAVLTVQIPDTPLDMPSTLLERRPDIAAAERRVAAANAQIGVAKAAFFPNLTLSATAGYQNNQLANWLTWPNRFWSVGPALAGTLFDGGKRRAASDQAIATYDENVANYRQTVLTGFQEVEDNLVALRILQNEIALQEAAVKAARESERVTWNQYQAGIVTYLDVVTAANTALTNERSLATLRGTQISDSVLLIKALGGGWSINTPLTIK